jgi:hypothetical protein
MAANLGQILIIDKKNNIFFRYEEDEKVTFALDTGIAGHVANASTIVDVEKPSLSSYYNG